MPWTRLGAVYVPNGETSWGRTHASLPTPVQINSNAVRVFFSSRDRDNRSSVDWVDLDLSDTPAVIRKATTPALGPGADGSFDDSGIGVGSVLPTDDGFRLYYMGWNLGVRAPWRNAIGLASAGRGLDGFERFSPGPILDRSPEDPYTLSYPWVLRLAADDWRMWYGSNLTWGATSADMSHVVKMARSRDGIRWNRDGRPVIGFGSEGEYALARPSVVTIGSCFFACFSCRGDRYRIGAAISSDGLQWKRIDDEFGLLPSTAGWDSEMACYPALFLLNEKLWMLYNGNNYGLTGFGLAVWEGELPIIR